MEFKKIAAAVTAAAMMSGISIPAVFAQEDYAEREYVVSEFVQSVGRNYLTGSDYVLSTFSDSDDIDEDYRSDFAKAVSEGLIKGYDNNTLRPKENITRVEALTILARCLDRAADDDTEEGEPIEFTDVPEWAKDDIDKLSAQGIVLGYGDGRLGAEDNITTEQVKLLTDRSDEVFNTTEVGESFYGYINNKAFRNAELSQVSYVDAKHGAIISNETAWSTFSDIYDKVSSEKDEIIEKLMNDELTYEDGSAEQRVHDMLLCIENASEPTESDKVLLSDLRERIDSAKTVDELIETSSKIYTETGINPLISLSTANDPETNYACPAVSFTTNETCGIMAFYPAAKTAGETYYKDALKKYIEACGGTFSDSDYEKAIEIQCDTAENGNYMSSVMLGWILRSMFDSDFTTEDYDEQTQKLLEVHPELDSQTYQATEDANKVCELDDDIYGMGMSEILTDNGYTDCYKVIYSDAASEDTIKAVFDEKNLNALKINALLALSDTYNCTLSDEEETALSDLSSISLMISMYVEGDDLSKDISEEFGALAEAEGLEESSEDTETTDYDISTIESILPNDIGLIYCKYYYDDATSDAVGDMIEEVWDAYLARFDKNEWMSESTKENAKKKIENMIAVVGYPDNYDYPTIVSPEDGGTYISNMLNINLGTRAENIKLCSDREFVRMMMIDPADTVNAYYIPELNIINIFAGILNAPVYDKDASRAANLGAIGAVIGHEIGHAFDASGSQYDELGRLVNWWTDEDAEYYEGLKANFVEYYKRFDVVSDVIQDSEVTIGENMADFAGLQCVMDIIGDDPEAQKEALASYATVWARLGTEKYLTDNQLLQDEHSSNNVRVDAVVASLDCFYELYDIDEDDQMYVAPEDRLKLW